MLGPQKYLSKKLTLIISGGFEFDQKMGYNKTQIFHVDKTQVTRDNNETSKELHLAPFSLTQLLLTSVNSSPQFLIVTLHLF